MTKAATAVAVSLACLAANASPSTSDEGSFLIQTFSPKLYGASPQNWAAVQDLRGVMYFGNTDGLLEYDGVSWRRIKVRNGSVVRALAVDDAGTVYVGAQREFGFLRANASGSLEYASLADGAPEEDRKFGNVWTVLATSKGVFFSSYERLFRWSPGGNLKIWRPRTKFGAARLVDGSVYVTDGAGLERVRGDELELVPGGEFFADKDVAGLAVLAGALTAFTRNGTAYRQTANGFEPVKPAIGALTNDGAYSLLRLADGRVAIGTLRGGVVLLGPEGGLQHVIGKDQGLDAAGITSLYADSQGGLWLTLYNGLARLQLNLTRFDTSSGLNGNVYALARQKGVLYAGTHIGLFRLDESAGHAPVFVPVPGPTSGTITALLPTPNGLLVGYAYGLIRVVNGAAKLELSLDVVNDLYQSTRDPNIVYAAGRRGVFRLRWDGRAWTKDQEVPTSGLDFKSVVEDDDGAVWVATRSDILRVNFTGTTPEVTRYDSRAGVPPDWKFIYRVQGRVVFATNAGLRRFDGRRFVPETAFGLEFANRPVLWLHEGPLHHIWITGEGYHGYLAATAKGYDWHPMPLFAAGIDEFYACTLDPDGVVWAAGKEGWLARYQSTEAPANETTNVILRRVRVLGHSMAMFSGGSGIGDAPSLKHDDNALRFEFASPFFDAPNAVEYQVKLDGGDRGWSDWTTETRKDYTNLWEGKYLFHVKARTPYGATSSEALFQFSIMPPWYRTWWAYVLYAVALVGALTLFIRWRLAQLAEQNRRLELIVAERTAELREEHEALQVQERKTESLLLNILPESVADELRTTGAVTPTAYDEVTVCFTDFVGFTVSSQKLPPRELVSALNEYFTAFDEIVGRYGLEKLKTIGDAYMFVSGLPKARRAHAVDGVLAALEMVEAVRRLSAANREVRWDIRVGLHTGPVVAGVVGVRKFAFDIWGSTVNFASRMESGSDANRVNLSARTYACVRDFIDCEPRGVVRTKKEQWEVEMYFARQVRPELMSDSADGIPAAFVERYKQAFGEQPRAFPAANGARATVAETSA